MKCDICGKKMGEAKFSVMATDILDDGYIICCCSKKCFGTAFCDIWLMDDFEAKPKEYARHSIEALRRALRQWMKRGD